MNQIAKCAGQVVCGLEKGVLMLAERVTAGFVPPAPAQTQQSETKAPKARAPQPTSSPTPTTQKTEKRFLRTSPRIDDLVAHNWTWGQMSVVTQLDEDTPFPDYLIDRNVIASFHRPGSVEEDDDSRFFRDLYRDEVGKELRWEREDMAGGSVSVTKDLEDKIRRVEHGVPVLLINTEVNVWLLCWAGAEEERLGAVLKTPAMLQLLTRFARDPWAVFGAKSGEDQESAFLSKTPSITHAGRVPTLVSVPGALRTPQQAQKLIPPIVPGQGWAAFGRQLIELLKLVEMTPYEIYENPETILIDNVIRHPVRSLTDGSPNPMAALTQFSENIETTRGETTEAWDFLPLKNVEQVTRFSYRHTLRGVWISSLDDCLQAFYTDTKKMPVVKIQLGELVVERRWMTRNPNLDSRPLWSFASQQGEKWVSLGEWVPKEFVEKHFQPQKAAAAAALLLGGGGAQQEHVFVPGEEHVSRRVQSLRDVYLLPESVFTALGMATGGSRGGTLEGLRLNRATLAMEGPFKTAVSARRLVGKTWRVRGAGWLSGADDEFEFEDPGMEGSWRRQFISEDPGAKGALLAGKQKERRKADKKAAKKADKKAAASKSGAGARAAVAAPLAGNATPSTTTVAQSQEPTEKFSLDRLDAVFAAPYVVAQNEDMSYPETITTLHFQSNPTEPDYKPPNLLQNLRRLALELAGARFEETWNQASELGSDKTVVPHVEAAIRLSMADLPGAGTIEQAKAVRKLLGECDSHDVVFEEGRRKDASAEGKRG